MNEWEQKEGEGGGVGVGERDEQAHPILIPGQAGVHSCRCYHSSRAWIWLGKGSINQLILQEAAYSGAAVRNALSRVCAGVPQPCTLHAAHTECAQSWAGWAQTPNIPGNGVSVVRRESISAVLQAQPAVLWHPLWAHTSTAGANKRGTHVQARLRNGSLFFPLKAVGPFSPLRRYRAVNQAVEQGEDC